MSKQVISFKSVEDLNKFDFSKLVVLDPEERESKSGNKKDEKTKGIKYHSMNILYKYNADEQGPCVIRFPEMETSGIMQSDTYFSEDGEPKKQIGSNLLTKEYIKFFDKFFATVLKLAYERLTDEKNSKIMKKCKLKPEDFDAEETRTFSNFYHYSDEKPDKKRIYFKIKPWTAFFVPTKNKKGAGYGTDVISQSSLLQTASKRLAMKIIPIWQPQYIYLGAKYSIVNYLKQAIILKCDKLKQASVVEDEINDMLGEDYDESELRQAIAEADDSEDSDSEEKPPVKSKASSSKSKKINQFMNDSDDDDDEEVSSKVVKNKASFSDDDN